MEGLKMKYFVLKPGGKTEYHRASRRAMRAYAASIRPTNPTLADDLLAWATRAALKQYGLKMEKTDGN